MNYNLIPVFSPDMKHVLLCKRLHEPYLGKLNFVGGKIEENESGFDAAYRELYEETGITENDIVLHHILDFTYIVDDCKVEVWAGVVSEDFGVFGIENELLWGSTDADFFSDDYAGEGNMGHIMKHCEMNSELIKSL